MSFRKDEWWMSVGDKLRLTESELIWFDSNATHELLSRGRRRRRRMSEGHNNGSAIMNNKECNKESSSTQSNVSFVKLRRTLSWINLQPVKDQLEHFADNLSPSAMGRWLSSFHGALTPQFIIPADWWTGPSEGERSIVSVWPNGWMMTDWKISNWCQHSASEIFPRIIFIRPPQQKRIEEDETKRRKVTLIKWVRHLCCVH